MNEIIYFIFQSIDFILHEHKNYTIKQCLKYITYLICHKFTSKKFNINLNNNCIKYINYKMNKIKFNQTKINNMIPIYKKILNDYDNYYYEFYYL